MLLRGFRTIAALFGLDLEVQGIGNLPPGPCIVAGAPHRTWLDPIVLALALPLEPRIYFLGDGEAIYRDAVRAFFIRRIGGVIPIWQGGRGIDSYVEATRRILQSGARLALFPERGPAVPVERARPFAAGVGYLATRTGSLVVPAVIGGTHELYLRRRMIVRFLEPFAPPASDLPGSLEERTAVYAFVGQIERRVAPDVSELLRETEPPPGFHKHWRWLTTAFH
jgi:1-acyl-sn-glycerol-3-phosphate acyltransferase